MMASLFRIVSSSSQQLARCTPSILSTTNGICINSIIHKLQNVHLQKPTVYVCSRWQSSSSNKLPDLPHLPNEGPYPKYEATPSPFRPLFWRRHGYNPNFYQGGLLPRPKEFEDKPLPPGKTRIRNSWSKRKALFGQNDYIDILGDGELHPVMLMKGPLWLRGFKGNEFQRILQQLRFEGRMLEEYYPTKLHDMKKRLFFLYKRLNRRRRAKFRSGRASWQRSRLLKLDKIF